MNPLYPPPQAQHGQQPAMPHEMHHSLPARGQSSSYQHSLPQIPSNLPPMVPAYAEHYSIMAPQEQHPTPTAAESQDAGPSPEMLAQIQRKIQPFVGTQDGRKYRLDVVQQPSRARMCGFGDKDRRPITPPPCVRLIVTDAATGKEIDCNDVQHSFFVLNVDLWSEDAQREVNLVRHTSATPSISSTTPASFAQIDNPSPAYTQILPPSRDPGGYAGPSFSPSVTPFSSGGYGPTAISPVGYNMVSNGYTQGPYYPAGPDMHAGVSPMSSQGAMSPYGGPPRMYNGPGDMMQRVSVQSGNTPQGMFTRNLIGSLSASAQRLTDPDFKIGIWFVLMDLSVRTEGKFRLRFSFVNVGPTRAPNGESSSSVNTGKAPVLASCYSDVFVVFSAKKFPGVCESTSLSKCFAGQGIKIPIRKEGQANKGGDDDDDD